jgi:hypothetical protein
MPNTTIDNTDDILDSRDIIARIEELTDERDSFAPDLDATPADWAAVNPEDAEELATLTALAEEAEGYAPDWTHGETLIRDSYFTEYAMGLLADCGDLPRELPHYIVIDEEATARNIRMDYTAVEFGDITYWIR